MVMTIQARDSYGERLRAALAELPQTIDAAADAGDSEGLRKALGLIEDLRSGNPARVTDALLHYFAANAWSGIQAVRKGTDSKWDWEQEELEQIIIHLRSARASDGFSQLTKIRKCQILTNLGNVFSHVGRCVEAIEYWDEALEIDPQFGMAIGNRGHGIVFYASLFEHLCHQVPFMKRAHTDLKTALDQKLEGNAAAVFRDAVRMLESTAPSDGVDYREPPTDSIGETPAEIKYRKWCVEQRLFLNPLNDLDRSNDVARDILTIPSLTLPAGAGLEHFGYFNQIKQEFVSSRYLYYEGVTSFSPHYSDKDVLLYDTLDFPAYSLAVEKMKLSFRALYSTFDKIAFFLNSYLGLSIAERKVNFRSLWYSNQRKREGLRPGFQRLENWPLRGLFWLSKDLYEDKPGFRDSIEPEGRALAEVRNHLEHKYIKLHGIELDEPLGILTPVKDTLAYSMSRKDFESKTLKLLSMVRASLIYLSLTVGTEERNRVKKLPSDRIAKIPLVIWRDQFKV
jgi:tetratricopeptide (TPR) repeat protein